MYTGLIELKDDLNLKLNTFEFTFITFRTQIENFKNEIKKDLLDYFKSPDKEKSKMIFSYIRCLIDMSISNLNCKRMYKEGIDIVEKRLEEYEKCKNLKLNFFKLMEEVCESRKCKSKAIFCRFFKCLDANEINFNCLKYVVKNIYSNEKFEYNDFADIIIISNAERLENGAIITSDIKWRRFILDNYNNNDFAKRSIEAMKKFYIKI